MENKEIVAAILATSVMGEIPNKYSELPAEQKAAVHAVAVYNAVLKQLDTTYPRKPGRK